MTATTIDAALFRRALKLAGSVVMPRSSIPILTAVRAVANGSLVLEGTDLDMCARAEIPCHGDDLEVLLEEPRTLLPALAAAGGEQVRLADAGGKTSIRAGAMDICRGCLPVDDFVDTERVETPVLACTLGEQHLAEIFRLVAAISTEETRYYLNGIHMKRLDGWTFRFAATNGHVLMTTDVPLPDVDGDLEEGIIIPRLFVLAAQRAFARPRHGLRLEIGQGRRRNARGPVLDVDGGKTGRRLTLAGDADGVDFSLTTKLIDGTYPDYERVYPGPLPHRMTVAKADLMRAARAVSATTRELPALQLEQHSADEIAVSLHSGDAGDCRYVIPARHNWPKGYRFGVNGRYLKQVLTALRGEEVAIGSAEATGVGGWRQEKQVNGALTIDDPANPEFRAVVMPMRV